MQFWHLWECVREQSIVARKDQELCVQDMKQFLETNYPDVQKIAFAGFQPSLLEMLSKSKYEVRVMDLNPNNIGQVKFGICVEDGNVMKEEIRILTLN